MDDADRARHTKGPNSIAAEHSGTYTTRQNYPITESWWKKRPERKWILLQVEEAAVQKSWLGAHESSTCKPPRLSWNPSTHCPCLLEDEKKFRFTMAIPSCVEIHAAPTLSYLTVQNKWGGYFWTFTQTLYSASSYVRPVRRQQFFLLGFLNFTS